MAIGLLFPVDHSGLIRFAVSPLFEAALSLHVLASPRQYPLHAPWVRACRDLDAELRREIRLFAFAFRSFPPAFLQAGLGEAALSYHDAMQRARQTPAEVVLADLLVPYADEVARRPNEPLSADRHKDHLLKVVAATDANAVHILLEAYHDPDGLNVRLAHLLDRYWQAVFARHWAVTEGRLIRDMATSKWIVQHGGPGPVLTGLSPHVRWRHRERSAVIVRRHQHVVDIRQAGLIMFVPSLFTTPRVRVYCDPPWPVSLVYPAGSARRRGQPEAPPDRLLAQFRALADQSRMQLLSLVARQPRSTRELAALLFLSESTVSRHMRQLASAGLVRTERAGHYVLYSCDQDAVEGLSPGLNELFRLKAPFDD